MKKIKQLSEFTHVSSEVSNALRKHIPIVALESTIISHGIPYPDNYNLAKKAEDLVRKFDCVPATIAVIDGVAKIGLNITDIKKLANGQNISKLSTSDLTMHLAKKETGSTTVAATLALAELVKIKVFATGGIGGVHRGSEINFDISADLKQLASSSITLVCAGPKAILDIPKTIEVLETLGVPVITFKKNNLPSFWSIDSGIKSPIVAKNLREIVLSSKLRRALGLAGGQLVCNPIPKIAEIKRSVIEPIIEKSIASANTRKISGKNLTPFLLDEVLKHTAGRSLQANKELYLNNVKLASKIAKNL